MDAHEEYNSVYLIDHRVLCYKIAVFQFNIVYSTAKMVILMVVTVCLHQILSRSILDEYMTLIFTHMTSWLCRQGNRLSQGLLLKIHSIVWITTRKYTEVPPADKRAFTRSKWLVPLSRTNSRIFPQSCIFC